MDKYYAVKTLDLARAIHFITGEKYLIFDDINDCNRKIYSFKNTEKLRKSLDILNNARRDLWENK